MSAYMMDKEDIQQIIAVALHGPSDAQNWTPTIQPNQADDLGDMLVLENLSSIHYRYPDTVTNPEGTPGPCEQYWLKPFAFELPAEIVSRDGAQQIIKSYQYQSCEHPEWEKSDARTFSESLHALLTICELKPKPPAPKVEVIHYSITEVAKLIRAELKKAFPDTKFSVRSQSYSMGCHINISYTDGPPAKAVEAITDKFCGKTFDGMDDSTHYHDSDYQGKRVHFAGSRPSVRREFTNEYIDGGPQKTVESLLQAKCKYDNTWQCRENAWRVLSSWDARWETLERAVERYLCENVIGYSSR